MSLVSLSYISIITRQVSELPDFYIEVFGLEEILASRSDRYRELSLGDVKLGFPSVDTYQLLDMGDQADPTGVRTLITFAVETAALVDRLTGLAVDRRGRLVKPPFATSFGQYLSVILDPEGNAIRISAVLP